MEIAHINGDLHTAEAFIYVLSVYKTYHFSDLLPVSVCVLEKFSKSSKFASLFKFINLQSFIEGLKVPTKQLLASNILLN